MPVLRVALDLPLHRLFDYVAESASTADIGLRVKVESVSEIAAAGFKHVATGDFLRNPDDPRTVSVHRSGIRNDEFVVRFQKPM